MDVAEILARIEAIDWQLAKPGAMALSRGWTREEVAGWAIRANDARAHLVGALVELRSAIHDENRALKARNLELARENEALADALRLALDGHLTPLESVLPVREARQMLAIVAKEISLQVRFRTSRSPAEREGLRSELQATHAAQQRVAHWWHSWKQRHPTPADGGGADAWGDVTSATG